MKADKSSIELVFRYVKKDETSFNNAFDLLFEEVFKTMNINTSIVATK